ncbi:MAG: cation transporter [Candidatus Dormibacteria bacterium]
MSTVVEASPGGMTAALSRARLAQGVTAGWLVLELALALLAGVAARSVALTAFGADSAVELVTAVVVLRQLRGPSFEVGSASPEARRASRVVGIGLYGVAAYIVLASGVSLLAGLRPSDGLLGLSVASLSVVVMTALWRWRLRLSEELHSAPLRADAACSAVCVYMGLTLLGGVALNQFLGWWWADQVAALGMTWWIVKEAREAMQSARTGEHCETC